MKKRINHLLRKCKTLSRQLSRSSSYTSLRPKSAREDGGEEIFVGSSRRRYVIRSEHLSHPLVTALIERDSGPAAVVKCEVVLFDHLLWMLENADPNIASDSHSLQELADLYVY
ncbi:auxin-responsive protein SAUR78-like [Salvia splendens]|uniref:auxin-responsive protein SAUR78-like n=1 Tax=Salvia splendens TaxID=180675 RepID=UPI0011010A51|nr:auxin-responsive protein SAUR78-like [Salvia splendens]